jgi:predicted exporter
MRRLEKIWVVAAVLLAGVATLLLVRYTPLQTDLLALLPPTERSATAERAVTAMRDAAGNRAVFLIGHADPVTARKAAERFAEALTASGAFASVQHRIPAMDPRALALPHRDFRFGLLAEVDRRALAEGKFDVKQWLIRRLNDPLRVSVAGGVAQDPFGFFGNFVASLPLRHLRLELEDGLLVTRSPKSERLHVLVTGELPGSAYDDRVQRPVLAAVESAEKALEEVAADAELLRTGAVFFAAAARSSAEHEIDLIGAGSLLGIVLLMLAVFRSVRPLLLGLLTVAIGLGAAVSTTVLVHGELHLLTLVFGASLIGEAIDYSIQYFGAHAASGADWEPRRGLAAIRPGLTLALATSLLGYAALIFMPFPAVRQIALFALAGLAAAFISVVLLLPRLLGKPYRHDISAITAPAGRFIDWWRARVPAPAAAAVALVVLVACAPGWLRLQSDDDVRALTSRPAALLAQEARIRALTGVEIGTQFFVVEAASAEGVLIAEEKLTARLRDLAASGALRHYHAVSSFVPSGARQTENRALLRQALLQGEGKQLEQTFQQVGLRSGVATELARAYGESEGRLLTADAWLASPSAAPFRHLWLGRSEHGFASIVAPSGAVRADSLATAADGVEHVVFVDKAGSVTRLFAQYRKGFSYGLAAAVLVVLLVLAWRYGWAGGGAVLLPTLLGIAAALAVAGYAGLPLTLFSVMALMLVLGVGVNYSIFLIEGRARGGTTLVAVTLSAATTILSFGLLAFSSTPALARFGSTLLAGIAVAVLLSPLALALAPDRRSQ